MRSTFRFLALCIISLLLFACGRREEEVKNIIILIGDGMGAAHMTALDMHSEAPLAMSRASNGGYIRTYSANNRVTDSSAAATAMATGRKTNNSFMGIDPQGEPMTNIMELAHRAGLGTGIMVTDGFASATPGGFVSHVASRYDFESITAAYADGYIDVAVGGDGKFFNRRSDGRNLVEEMTAKGYGFAYTIEDFEKLRGGKSFGLLADSVIHMLPERDPLYSSRALSHSLELLARNYPGGFLIMAEGSHIDHAAHNQNLDEVLSEMADFDRMVQTAFDFADRNPGTLVIVLADHETGGLTIASGDYDFTLPDRGIQFLFGTISHTAVFAPLLTYGAGADRIGGIIDNTDIFGIVRELLLD